MRTKRTGSGLAEKLIELTKSGDILWRKTSICFAKKPLPFPGIEVIVKGSLFETIIGEYLIHLEGIGSVLFPNKREKVVLNIWKENKFLFKYRDNPSKLLLQLYDVVMENNIGWLIKSKEDFTSTIPEDVILELIRPFC